MTDCRVSVAIFLTGYIKFIHRVGAFRGYCAASIGNLLPTCRRFLFLDDGTDRLSRNVGKKLPLLPPL